MHETEEGCCAAAVDLVLNCNGWGSRRATGSSFLNSTDQCNNDEDLASCMLDKDVLDL